MLTKHVTENCLEKKPPGSSSLLNFGGSGVWLGAEDWSAPRYIKISSGQNLVYKIDFSAPFQHAFSYFRNRIWIKQHLSRRFTNVRNNDRSCDATPQRAAFTLHKWRNPPYLSLRVFRMQNICKRKEACSCKKARFGWQANSLRGRASEMDIGLFISEAEKRPATWDPRDHLTGQTQTKAH